MLIPNELLNLFIVMRTVRWYSAEVFLWLLLRYLLFWLLLLLS